MKKHKKIIFIAFLFLLPSLAKAEFVYPFKEISKSDCRFQSFDTLSADCKKDLPILHTADYKKYKDDYNYRRVYTVLWGATYDYGWDTGYGSHQWVDIATSEWTPVYAIWDWVIRIAWEMTGRWKAVVIEHTINGRKIYSNYAHLSKIRVTSWQTIKAWDLIWKVGHTWNSYGNHLHFQIDLDTSNIHPYYPTRLTCSDPVWNEMTLVNKWYCKDDLINKTVDPLAFLETNWAIITKTQNNEQVVAENKKQVAKTKIAQISLLSRADIQKMEVENFLKNYKIDFSINKLYTNLAIWDTLKLTVNITDRFGKAYNWVTPDYINFALNNSNLSVFPQKVLILENGKRDIVFNALKKGTTSVEIKIGSTTIKKIDFFIFWKNDVIYGNKAWIAWDKWISIWDKSSSKVVIYKDSYKLIWVPYSGKYVLTSKNKNILFCLKQPKTTEEINSVMAQKCSTEDYKDTIVFWINDTFQWIFYYDYKVIWSDKAYIESILNWKTNALLWEKKLEISFAKDVNNANPYYNEISRFLQAWIVENKSKNYFLTDTSLTQADAISFISNTLYYILDKENKKAKADNDKIRQIKLSIFTLRGENSDKFKSITRIQFFNLIYKYLIFTKKDIENIKYLDLTADLRKKVWNVFDENNTWRDKFWARYFQWDKEITRWEAVYMISRVK